MLQSPEFRSNASPLDMGELRQTLHAIVEDRGFFEVFDEFASMVSSSEDQLWLQIDGVAPLDDVLDCGNEDDFEVSEWVVHSSFGDLTDKQPAGVDIHACPRALNSAYLNDSFPVGLCFQDATLTLSRNGHADAGDRFLAKPGEGLSALIEGLPVTVHGEHIGKVIRNSDGLCQIRFNADCSVDFIDTVLSQLAYSNAQSWGEEGILIDWSFCCYYIGLRHQPDEQVFVGTQRIVHPSRESDSLRIAV